MKVGHPDPLREFRFTVIRHLRLGIREIWALIPSNKLYLRKKV
jgi:hypothetical protein